jgi:hypothetical protein
VVFRARDSAVWQDFNAIIDDIKGRSAKLVSAIDPADLEHKKMIAERKRVYGNGSQR